MTPRVTYEGEIILDLSVESSARGQDTNIAGQNLPSFLSRKVTTKLRLRDGESNLLAGLLREDERRSLRGFPGMLRLPVVKQLFSANDDAIQQTDIVMLLTPRIIRTHELTADDLSPIYVGTQSNMGIGGPPPLIASGQVATSSVTPPGAAPAPSRPLRSRAGAGTPPPASPSQPGTAGAAPVAPLLPRRRALNPCRRRGNASGDSRRRGVTPQVPPGHRPFPGRPGCRSRLRSRRAASRCSSGEPAPTASRRQQRRRICSVFQCLHRRRHDTAAGGTPPDASRNASGGPAERRRSGTRADSAACRWHATGRRCRRASHAEPAERDARRQRTLHGSDLRSPARRGYPTVTMSITFNPALLRVRSVSGRHVHAPGRRDAGVHPAGGRRSGPHRHRHRPRPAIRPALRPRACWRRFSSSR